MGWMTFFLAEWPDAHWPTRLLIVMGALVMGAMTLVLGILLPLAIWRGK
jgi:uncharacterized protein involved in exopolysaccharide biosynthesis